MFDELRRCPVCWQSVQATPVARVVYLHLDTARTRCPMSGKAFDLCYPLEVNPKMRAVA